MAAATNGYTGADIKEVVTMGLKLAFHARQELTADHLLNAVPEVRPLSQTDPVRVAEMTEWLERHTRAASGSANASGTVKKSGSTRVRKVGV